MSSKSILTKVLKLSTILLMFSLVALILSASLWFFQSNKSANNTPLIFKKNRVRFSKRASDNGCFMKLKNINFRLSDKINMKIYNLEAEVLPLNKDKIVDFDDISSFAIDIYQGQVSVPLHVLEYIFNEVVFNYPGSPFRKLNMKFIDATDDKKSNVRRILLKGEMKMVVWLPFEMKGKMLLDKKRVLITLEAEKITTLGNPLAKELMQVVGLTLEELVKLPSSRGVSVKKNKVFVEPFAIFPPPKIGGYLSSMVLGKNALILSFANKHKLKFAALADAKAKNYLFISGGKVKFGRLIMNNALLQMVDLDEKDLFDFYLSHYVDALVKGTSKIKKNGAVVAYLPDYNSIRK